MGVKLNSRFWDLMEVNDLRNTGTAFLPKERLHRLKLYCKQGGELNVQNTYIHTYIHSFRFVQSRFALRLWI